MDPLIRILNEKFPKITIETETETMATNHLLYIDDLKLMAKEEKIIKMMCKEVSECCKKIGLTINSEKSATNVGEEINEAKVIQTHECYKYLGITEETMVRHGSE